jgi:hypothetical protein
VVIEIRSPGNSDGEMVKKYIFYEEQATPEEILELQQLLQPPA